MKNNGLKYGFLGALTLILYLLGVYFVDKKLLTNSLAAYWLPLLLIYPALMYKAGMDEIAQNGLKDFRETVRIPFMTFAVANVFFWLCMYGIHLADPDLVRIELTQQLDFAQGQLKNGMGDPEQMNKVRQQVNDIQAELSNPKQPFGPYIFSMAIWKILGFGIAAAITAVLRATRK